MTDKHHANERFDPIKAELDEVKQNFFQLLDEISDSDWNRKLPGGAWTAKQELVHIVQALEVLPKGINLALGGGSRSFLSYVPSGIRGWVNGYIVIPARSRRATKAIIAEEYDRAFDALVGILEQLPEEAWHKGAAYPQRYRTIEQMAHRPREHFEEHLAHLRRFL